MIWATGFALDHSFVDAPVFDADGGLVHERGVTRPGALLPRAPLAPHPRLGAARVGRGRRRAPRSGDRAPHRHARRVAGDRRRLVTDERGELRALVGGLDDGEAQALVIGRVPRHVAEGGERQRRLRAPGEVLDQRGAEPSAGV